MRIVRFRLPVSDEKNCRFVSVIKMREIPCISCRRCLSNHLSSCCQYGAFWDTLHDVFIVYPPFMSSGTWPSGALQNALLFVPTSSIDLMSLKQRCEYATFFPFREGGLHMAAISASKTIIFPLKACDTCVPPSRSHMDVLFLLPSGLLYVQEGFKSFFHNYSSGEQNLLKRNDVSTLSLSVNSNPPSSSFDSATTKDHHGVFKSSNDGIFLQESRENNCHCDLSSNPCIRKDGREMDRSHKTRETPIAPNNVSSSTYPPFKDHSMQHRNTSQEGLPDIDETQRKSLSDSSLPTSSWNPISFPNSLTHIFKLSASSISVLRIVLFLVLISATCRQTKASTTKAAIHAIIPHHIEMKSPLSREFRSTVLNFRRDRRNYRLRQVFMVRENLTFLTHDTPTEILETFCKHILEEKAVAIITINNPLRIRRRTSSNKYILSLAKYFGIPVISWDTEFSGSGQGDSDYRLIQLAPTIQHQVSAMVSLLERYNWTHFTIITSSVAGDAEFVAALESMVERSQKPPVRPGGKRLELLSRLHISNSSQAKEMLSQFVSSDSRVFLLHCSTRASILIFEAATALGLVSKEHVWILTRTSIPTGKYAPRSFPVGLMGVSFDYGIEAMKQVVKVAMKTWLSALLDIAKTPAVLKSMEFPPQLSCDSEERQFWKDGSTFYQYMLNTTIKDEPHVKFNRNGTVQQTELVILNLQWDDGQRKRKKWREVGRWKRHGLKMEDITWPGESSIPPSGRPKRAFLRITTLHELPYVVYRNTTKLGVCDEKAVPCYIYDRDSQKKLLQEEPVLKCCVGLSMDLLKILSEQLDFDFRLEEVKDASWGGRPNGTWNGLVKALLDDECDMVVTAFKINPERASAVLFSVPYLETGIKIIVALRNGAISPTAFLEPFDYYSWCMIAVISVNIIAVVMFLFELRLTRDRKINLTDEEPYDYASWSLILVFSVHATGSSILIFEWLSPYGLNRGQTPMREHKFSLFRSFWLIWAMLFSTSVQTDSPRGIASRFLANIWALFALVFLASYTANLAAFMITKEEYYDLSGIQDYRLQNPYVMNPPFKYATIPNGTTEAMLRTNYKEMFNYMKVYNQPDVDAGVNALKTGKIQAFIYDSSVLEYYASRDPKCRLVTVGNRYAMTGYGIGFPPDPTNPWIDKVNRVILNLQAQGELDRLQKFWLAGACDLKKEKGISNRTLGIINFTSAFILLGTGILLGLLLLVLEHIYFIFGRNRLRKWDKCGCCALVSLSMGKTLRMKDTVDEAMSLVANNRCKDPICETQMWKLKHKLDLALLRIENLEGQLSIVPEETSVARLRHIISDHNSGRLPNHKPTYAESRKPETVAVYINSIGNHNTKRQRNPLLNTKASTTLTQPSTIPEVTFSNEQNGNSCCIHDNPCPPEDFGDLIQSLNLDSFHTQDLGLDEPSKRAWTGELNTPQDSQNCDEKCEECIALNLLDDVDSECESTQSTGTTSLGANISGKFSPWPGLKRSPSYTSAIGGSFGSDTDSSKSPNVNKYRQYDGKTYMGVGGVTL